MAEYRILFNGIKIGIIPSSRGSSKNWAYSDYLVEYLLKQNHNVFLFDPFDTKQIYDKHLYYVDDRNLRDYIIKLSAMDLVISPDTGPAHIAGALNVPLIVVCSDAFSDLYNKYPNCKVLEGKTFSANNYKLPYGVTDSIFSRIGKNVYNSVIDRITRHTNDGIYNISVNDVANEAKLHIAKLTPKKQESENTAFVRIRGIGDVILSLPAVRTYKFYHPSTKITYITNNAYKSFLEQAGYIDDVIGVNYNHATAGYPPLPQEINPNDYDEIINMINRVDFEPDSGNVHRTEMFSALMKIDSVDYSLDWRFDIHEEWKVGLLEKYPDIKPDKLVSVQVDSQGLSRTWQLERQAEVIKMLTKRGYQVAILSDKAYDTDNPDVINLTKKLSFNEYVSIIRLSQLVIGADSSAMHIAGLLNVKGLGLYGSVDPQLRVSHYESISTILSKRFCVPCNDWQTRICSMDRNSPRCLYEISPRLIYAKSIKILEG